MILISLMTISLSQKYKDLISFYQELNEFRLVE